MSREPDDLVAIADTLAAMNNLAASYFDAGRLAEALKVQEEALPLFRKLNAVKSGLRRTHTTQVWIMADS